MTIAQEEVFGPVLNVMRFDDFDQAIDVANKTLFGNGACIYTQSGKAAREFKHRIKVGMVGINVGVPAPPAPKIQGSRESCCPVQPKRTQGYCGTWDF